MDVGSSLFSIFSLPSSLFLVPVLLNGNELFPRGFVDGGAFRDDVQHEQEQRECRSMHSSKHCTARQEQEQRERRSMP